MTKGRGARLGTGAVVAGFLALALLASAGEPQPSPASGAASSGSDAVRDATPRSIPAGIDFGAGVTLDRVADLREVVGDPSRFAQGPILLHGRISDVCQRKGCWTVLSQGDANLRVRFKDYAFFLPPDSSGKQAYVEGVVKLETLSEQSARHYASESKNADPNAIHGPQREVGFTASGVRLVSDRASQ